MLRLKPQIGQQVKLRLNGLKVRGVIVRFSSGVYVIDATVGKISGYYVTRKPEEVKVLP